MAANNQSWQLGHGYLYNAEQQTHAALATTTGIAQNQNLQPLFNLHLSPRPAFIANHASLPNIFAKIPLPTSNPNFAAAWATARAAAATQLAIYATTYKPVLASTFIPPPTFMPTQTIPSTMSATAPVFVPKAAQAAAAYNRTTNTASTFERPEAVDSILSPAPEVNTPTFTSCYTNSSKSPSADSGYTYTPDYTSSASAHSPFWPISGGDGSSGQSATFLHKPASMRYKETYKKSPTMPPHCYSHGLNVGNYSLSAIVEQNSLESGLPMPIKQPRAKPKPEAQPDKTTVPEEVPGDVENDNCVLGREILNGALRAVSNIRDAEEESHFFLPSGLFE